MLHKPKLHKITTNDTNLLRERVKEARETTFATERTRDVGVSCLWREARDTKQLLKMATHAQWGSRDHGLLSHFSTLQNNLFSLISWNHKYDERYCKFCNIKGNCTFFLKVIKVFRKLSGTKRIFKRNSYRINY